MNRRDHFRQAQKRRYQSRNYRNPHLDGRKPFPWKFVVVALGILVIVLGTIVSVFAHPAFRIRRVEVLGIEYIQPAVLETVVAGYLDERALLFFKRSNRFLFSGSNLSRMLEEQFALAHILVGLQEGTVYVQLEERTSNLFWKTQGRLYVVDLEGVVVREVQDEQDTILQQPNLKELPIFIDTNDVAVDVASLVLTPEEVKSAFTFFEHLTQAGIAYTHIELDRVAGKWVKLVTQQGYSILFDLTGDIDEQYKNLTVVLQEVADTSTLEYIDLRFGDKVYYR